MHLHTALNFSLPDAIRLYLHHTENGLSFRELARREGKAASTVLRQVRRYELRRDDPLIDEALNLLARGAKNGPSSAGKDVPTMSIHQHRFLTALTETDIEREARRILRRLSEPKAILAIAPDLEKAVILRMNQHDEAVQTAVLTKEVAQAFALKGWISCQKQGRLSTYEITALGRNMLRSLLKTEEGRPAKTHALRRPRCNITETPLLLLARRRDKDGRFFLSPDLIRAAEQLREDFELAQMHAPFIQSLEPILSQNPPCDDPAPSPCPVQNRARQRVTRALRDLGPGLGDITFRVCCLLEGLETAEKRMGWAARSAKIVLRIALHRLRCHYEENYGKHGPLIG